MSLSGCEHKGQIAYSLWLDGLIKLGAVCDLVVEVGGAGILVLQLRPIGSHKLPNLLQEIKPLHRAFQTEWSTTSS